MDTKQNADEYSPEETEARLRAIMRGAAKGPPTPLKAIPKRTGGARKLRKESAAKRKP